MTWLCALLHQPAMIHQKLMEAWMFTIAEDYNAFSSAFRQFLLSTGREHMMLMFLTHDAVLRLCCQAAQRIAFEGAEAHPAVERGRLARNAA